MSYSFSKKVSIYLILKEALKGVKSKITFLFIFISASKVTWLNVGGQKDNFREHGGDCERCCSARRPFSKILTDFLTLFHINIHSCLQRTRGGALESFVNSLNAKFCLFFAMS